ncbi:hypothetical protein FHX37_2405 [Haloactinospora alba]|uniref:DUF503 domain-containing protein n=1 Tax=Haloactinospora alba TaxID=405555 RepID=A0A543NKQ5_9ACTN|nr:DUF503 domain-containing protein [Haloactinospora alba]TQN32445.1 hypothetical protein FHX37_2405 [Haloactinospora alba]
MFIGALTLDILLGDVRSLKQKRSVVRPIVAELQRAFSVSVAETGNQELYRRCEIGVAVAASTAAHCSNLMDSCERTVADHPEIDLLSARQRIFNAEEESDDD